MGPRNDWNLEKKSFKRVEEEEEEQQQVEEEAEEEEEEAFSLFAPIRTKMAGGNST